MEQTLFLKCLQPDVYDPVFLVQYEGKKYTLRVSFFPSKSQRSSGMEVDDLLTFQLSPYILHPFKRLSANKVLYEPYNFSLSEIANTEDRKFNIAAHVLVYITYALKHLHQRQIFHNRISGSSIVSLDGYNFKLTNFEQYSLGQQADNVSDVLDLAYTIVQFLTGEDVKRRTKDEVFSLICNENQPVYIILRKIIFDDFLSAERVLQFTQRYFNLEYALTQRQQRYETSFYQQGNLPVEIEKRQEELTFRDFARRIDANLERYEIYQFFQDKEYRESLRHESHNKAE